MVRLESEVSPLDPVKLGWHVRGKDGDEVHFKGPARRSLVEEELQGPVDAGGGDGEQRGVRGEVVVKE